jgi:hypothetical protein
MIQFYLFAHLHMIWLTGCFVFLSVGPLPHFSQIIIFR